MVLDNKTEEYEGDFVWFIPIPHVPLDSETFLEDSVAEVDSAGLDLISEWTEPRFVLEVREVNRYSSPAVQIDTPTEAPFFALTVSRAAFVQTMDVVVHTAGEVPLEPVGAITPFEGHVNLNRWQVPSTEFAPSGIHLGRENTKVDRYFVEDVVNWSGYRDAEDLQDLVFEEAERFDWVGPTDDYRGVVRLYAYYRTVVSNNTADLSFLFPLVFPAWLLACRRRRSRTAAGIEPAARSRQNDLR